MIAAIADSLRAAASGGSALALPLAFVAGLTSSAQPCCVAMYPAAAAACCVTRETRHVSALRTGAAFVTGIALSTSLLGVVAALAGRTFAGLGSWANYVLAALTLLLSVHFLGWIELPTPRLAAPGLDTARWTGAFASGLLLSVVLIPCGTPMLAALMSVAAYRSSLPFGVALLFLYGLGAGLPILPVGAFASGLSGRLAQRGWKTAIDRATGVGLLVLGLFLIWSA